MKSTRIPSLIDLAFKGRNQTYGAYLLRKKYFRYLTVSVISSLFLLGLMVLIPFAIYYFEPGPQLNDDMIYEVSYYSMMTPPQEDLNELAKALSAPLREIRQVPVVEDTLKPEEQKPVEQTPPKDEIPEEVLKKDSIPRGPGGSGFNQGTGGDQGLATVIDVYPRFPGGEEARLFFLRKNVHYPEIAQKKQIQGVVMLVFIIETDGSMTHFEISKGIGGGCEEEALRVARSMPRWDPGKRSGQPVRVMVRMPVVFRLPGKPQAL